MVYSRLFFVFLPIPFAITTEILVHYYGQKAYISYHIYNALELTFTSVYFVRFVNSGNWLKIGIGLGLCWMTLALLNLFLFQSGNRLNSYFLILESFTVIALAIYALFRLFLDDFMKSLWSNLDFWIWALQLFFWSSTLFYWAFIELIPNTKVTYYDAINHFQAMANIIFYIGLSYVFVRYKRIGYEY